MLIVSDLINNKTQIVESLKKRNKDFSKEIDLVIEFDKKRIQYIHHWSVFEEWLLKLTKLKSEMVILNYL